MANEEQLSILKQGVDVWNKWREENPNTVIDLSNDDFSGSDLHNVDFHEADLSNTSFDEADLREANLNNTTLFETNLSGAHLSNSQLMRAHVAEADLRGADLSNSILWRADVLQTDLAEVNFNQADLREAKFSAVSLAGATFSDVSIGQTVIGNTNLSEVIDLKSVRHFGPSTIGFDTVANSRGTIPEVFLRGCGLSDVDIEYTKLFNPQLNNEEINKVLYRMYDLRATQALQISPLFISYSHADSAFVDKLERRLSEKGIRFWRDIHEMKAGRMEKQIDRAISQNSTVLLVLSEHSLSSDWVEHEVRTARGLEKEMGRDVLCPVALDDSWKTSRWPKRVMEQIMEYNILDFSAWKDESKFDGMFRKLIDGLELFYKG